MKHDIQRIRHDLRLRNLTVASRAYVTPHMLRLGLSGEALHGFTSLSPDDHIKVFAPGADGPQRRDYTPRRYDAAQNILWIDFALHEAGPVTAWAMGAAVGDPAQIGGPKGSAVVPHDFDWWLLVGDETALPAIGRRVEELPAGTPVTSLAAVRDAAEEQPFDTAAAHTALWVHRPAEQADDAAPLLAALKAWTPPAGEGFIWIAAEAKVARALRAYVLEDLGHPPRWVKASGYWVKGQADSHDKLGD